MKKLVLALFAALSMAACHGTDDAAADGAASAKQLSRAVKTVSSGYANEVQLLYIAYFGRPADPGGLANFESALLSAGAPTDIQGLADSYAGNGAIRSLIDSFGTSPESLALYGSVGSAGDAAAADAFVTAVFKNMLNRAPAGNGLNFWADAITSGSVTQGQAALSIAAGALANTSAQGVLDAELVSARVAVGAEFTAQVTAQNASGNYVGSGAAAAARAMLGTVLATTDPASFEPTVVTTVAALTPASSTAALVAKLGKPSRFLVGLGAGNDIGTMNTQGIKPDIIDTYLVGVGAGSWITWNSPSGSYLTDVAQADDAIGATPMYTLYQMAQNGDGNLSGLTDSSFMNNYWSQVRLMFQLLGNYDKPALVNLEPDFWGYVQLQSPNGDPGKLAAVVSTQAECTSFADNAIGIAQCMLAMARKYAPKALIGYPASFFGETAPQVATMMKQVGAQNADFIVAQTSDRDAGCWEVANPPPECTGRGNGPWYWDETNQSSPNYTESLTLWSTYRSDLGNNLPIIWWQTPMGVPSATPGGSYQHYRDNHVHYMLGNAGQYVNIGSAGAVFSSGATSQTTINTDGGQFQKLLAQYLAGGGSRLK